MIDSTSASDVGQPAPIPPGAPASGTIRRRILVMDDEEIICELLRELLGSFGHEVATSSEGGETVRRYREAMELGRPFDLVIVDLTIPVGGMNGEETIRALRTLDPKVRAIVASGYLQNPVLTNYRDHGFCGMVTKPYSISELLREVSRAMEA
jgi:CheY-like chemotaxis protein